jgi:hypothetical protein
MQLSVIVLQVPVKTEGSTLARVALATQENPLWPETGAARIHADRNRHRSGAGKRTSDEFLADALSANRFWEGHRNQIGNVSCRSFLTHFSAPSLDHSSRRSLRPVHLGLSCSLM